MPHFEVNNKIKALMVFDWNGTLIDDTEAIIYADNCALAHFGGQPISTKTYLDTVSIPKREFFMLHGCSPILLNENPKAIADFAAIHYQEKLSSCGLRAGAIEILKFLKEQAVHVIILSNDMNDNIWSQLRRFEIKQLYRHRARQYGPSFLYEACIKTRPTCSVLKKNRTISSAGYCGR